MQTQLTPSAVEWPLPLAITEFSFCEDKLLLSAYWANEYEDITTEEVNNALCYLYAKARIKSPAEFPKPERYNLYSRALALRLDTLINASIYAPLVSLISREIALQEERDSLLKDPDTMALKMQPLLAFPPQSDTQERMILQKEVSDYGKEKITIQFPLYIPLEDLKKNSPILEHIADSLLYTNLKSQEYISFTTRKSVLTRQSNLIARLYAQKTRNLPPAIYGDVQSCLTNGDDDVAIELADRFFPHMASCKQNASEEHLYPDGFARFLLFCRHPTVITEQKLIESTTSLARTYISEVENDFAALIDIRREDRLDCLKAWKKYAEQRLCDEVTKNFKEDIRDIQLMYEQLLNNGGKQIHEIYTTHQVESLQYYDKLEMVYKERLQIFFTLTQEKAGTNRRLKDLQTLERMIFSPIDQLPKLMVMAISLESDPFTDAVSTLLARNVTYPEVYTSPALISCKLVTERIYRDILRRISTKDLTLLLVYIRSYGCVLLKDCANEALLNIGFSSAIQQTKIQLSGAIESSRLSKDEQEKHELVLQNKAGVTLCINPLTGENRELKEFIPLIEGSSIHIDDETLKELEHTVLPSIQELSSFHQHSATNIAPDDPSETSATLYSTPNIHGHISEESQEHSHGRLRKAHGQEQDQKQIKHGKLYLLPFEYLIEELRGRRAAMRETYKQWSEDAIKMAITSGTEPFLDLLTETLENRKLVKQYQVLDGTVCMLKQDNLYDLDVSGLHIELKTPKRYITIKCNKYIISSSQLSRVYFEFCLKNLPNTTNLALGVMYEEQLFHNFDSPAINGAFITTNGFLFERGQRKFCGVFLASNDVVGAIVDMSVETIHFYKNGKSILAPIVLNPHSHKPRYQDSESLRDQLNAQGPENRINELDLKLQAPLDVISETTAALSDISLVFDANEVLRRQQLQQSIDEKLMNRLDSIARARHVYRIRPAIVSYCDIISPKSRPYIKMNFCKPYFYDTLINFTNTGYL